MVRDIRIGLLWHTLGHGNLGVDALTRANIAILRAACERLGLEPFFTTLGAGEKREVPDLPPSVTIGPRPRLKPLFRFQSEFLSVIHGSDVVIDIGEGDSFTDIYGMERYAYHVGTKIAVLGLRRPLVLAPQTIGPFDNPLRARVATAVMNRARAVFSRDRLSTGYMERLGVRAPTAEYIDVAFRLPFVPTSKDGARRRIGLNVSGLLYHGGYTGRNELGLTLDYQALSHGLIEAFQAQGAEVHLVPHVIDRTSSTSRDDDMSVVAPLVERYPALRVPAPFASASEAKSYMSGLDFVVAGRMHACIGAFSAGVPVVPIAYSRKFNGLFDTLGYPFYVDGKALRTEDAQARVLAWAEQPDPLARAIEAGRAVAAARLAQYEDRMTDILRTVVNAASA